MSRLPCGLALVCGLALLAGACGGGAEHLSKQQIAKVEAGIHDLADRVYVLEVGPARCPQRVVREQGTVIGCAIDVGGERLIYRVTQSDDQGNTEVVPTAAVHLVQRIEDVVTDYAAEQRTPVASVSCGSREVIVRRPGDIVTCSVDFVDGTSGIARLQVRNTSGTIALSTLRKT